MLQFISCGIREYLILPKAYDIMPVGKKDMSAHGAKQKPR